MTGTLTGGGPNARRRSKLEETPYGRRITSDGWFVLNLGEAFTVRNEEKGGAAYLIEPREAPFGPNLGVNFRVLWPGEPSALLPLGEPAGGVPRRRRASAR